MSLLQQLVQFLSQPPESLVYHVVTLLALQATFWLALWQLRRKPEDSFARRLVWASGGIIIGRLIILFASLAIAGPVEAAGILPPLERAIDTATATLIVWALAPQFRNQPRLGDVIVLIILILTGFMYAFFAQNWLSQIEAGALLGSYSTTEQARIWEVVQLLILGLGSALILFGRENQWPLRLAVVLILFISHVLSLWFLVIGSSVTTDIAYWVRLGNLVAFPTLAILTYRHNLTTLIPSKGFGRSMVEQLAYLLQLARDTVKDTDLDSTAEQALLLAAETLEAEFLALAIGEPEDKQRLRLFFAEARTPSEESQDTLADDGASILDLESLPSVKKAMDQHRQVELLPEGKGARQLHNIYQQLDLEALGSLLVEPLFVEDTDIGLLLLAGPDGRDQWPDPGKTLSPAVANFIAQALYNTRRYEMMTEIGDRPPFGEEIDPTAGLAVRVLTLEGQLAAENQRAEALAVALTLAEVQNQDERVRKLEDEIEALRESLVEAEDAMALAAASDAGVSTDWVMRTVSRYSGELEDAQMRVYQLEDQLAELSQLVNSGSITSSASELRTPLTSLGVYTDLLLSESLGKLGARQVTVLQRMKSSIENMTSLLDEIIALVRPILPHPASPDLVAVQATIEAAIGTVSTKMMAKHLKLDLVVDDELPALPTYEDTFYQIVARLLSSACLVSVDNGRVSVVANLETYSPPGEGGPEKQSTFLHLSIKDSGSEEGQGMQMTLFSGHPLPQDEQLDRQLVEAGEDLSVAMKLVESHGGRTWVEGEPDSGSIVSILLPISGNGTGALD
jgi:signal transduction histidine kinase